MLGTDGKTANLSLAFVQSDHENLHLVSTVYPTLQDGFAQLNQQVK